MYNINIIITIKAFTIQGDTILGHWRTIGGDGINLGKHLKKNTHDLKRDRQ